MTFLAVLLVLLGLKVCHDGRVYARAWRAERESFDRYLERWL